MSASATHGGHKKRPMKKGTHDIRHLLAFSELGNQLISYSFSSTNAIFQLQKAVQLQQLLTDFEK